MANTAAPGNVCELDQTMEVGNVHQVPSRGCLNPRSEVGLCLAFFTGWFGAPRSGSLGDSLR